MLSLGIVVGPVLAAMIGLIVVDFWPEPPSDRPHFKMPRRMPRIFTENDK